MGAGRGLSTTQQTAEAHLTQQNPLLPEWRRESGSLQRKGVGIIHSSTHVCVHSQSTCAHTATGSCRFLISDVCGAGEGL